MNTYGRVDVLVNNAGVVRDRTLLKMTDDEFDEVMQTNVYGSFYMAQACARAMRDAGGGTIINVGSDSGFTGPFGQSNYAAAKGAILGLTLTWARELPRYGITCNCVLPNALTAMTEGLGELLGRNTASGRRRRFPRALGAAAESAPLVALLGQPALELSERAAAQPGWGQAVDLAAAAGDADRVRAGRMVSRRAGSLHRVRARSTSESRGRGGCRGEHSGRNNAKEPHGTAHR